LHAPGRANRQEQPTFDAQIGKLRQGLARLIDSYAEGLIDKQEFEPRITRLRQRLTALEEQAQQLQDEAALQTELQLIIGRLEDFAAQVHGGLAAADWTSKRELIRALVKRVEVTQDQVNVVFRVDQRPTEPDPAKKSLQLCRGRANSALRGALVRVCQLSRFQHAGVPPLADQPQDASIFDSLLDKLPQKAPV
jgi:site-specific DNA recombinase